MSMNDYILSADVESYGDPSVGIAGNSVTVELGTDEFADKDHREEVRETLREMYAGLWDDKVNVTFSDEWSQDGYPLKY